MKPFRFFMKRRPIWLDLPPHGEDNFADDSKLVGATMPALDPYTFKMKKRLIYWSETNNRHYYGMWVNEDGPNSTLFHELPIINNPIHPNE